MNGRVLVLNQDYQAIAVSSVERAFCLVYLGKAEMVETHPEKKLRSVNASFDFPTVVRLRDYVRVPYRKVSPSRLNIFRRDDFRCAYCGTHKNLTLDHVTPRSQGGKDTWENLVTACQKCNTRKGSRTPEEAGMRMRGRAYRPSYIMYLTKYDSSVDDAWRPYLLY